MNEQKTYRIVRLVKTCDAVPAQWEGRTDEGEDVYIRYRFGEFRVHIGPYLVSDYDNFSETLVYAAMIGGRFDGTMGDNELRLALPTFVTIADPPSTDIHRLIGENGQ